MRQPGKHFIRIRATAKVREQHRGMRQVGRYINRGHSHHSDSRVFDLVTQQIHQLPLDLFGDALRARILSFHVVDCRE
jgi:hypothetical protein